MSVESLWQDALIPCFWKLHPADFVVEELWHPDNPADATGHGEHSLLLVEKQGQNTQWVARQLARYAGVRDMDVGYHGLKDRQSISRQWFSVYHGKRKVPPWNDFNIADVRVLHIGTTPRKLRRGNHWGNRFTITLRGVEGNYQEIDKKFLEVRASGFPNYFGRQRFGHEGSNLDRAEAWLKNFSRPAGRALRGIVLSAARSYLFNNVLEQRLRLNSWSKIIQGDILVRGDLIVNCLPGCCRFVPSGPLFGGAEFLPAKAGEIERIAVSGSIPWLEGLHREGARTSRRAFIAFVKNFSWSMTGNVVNVQFDLAPGVYASVLLEQVFCLKNSKEKLI